jgi:hypothetical protein
MATKKKERIPFSGLEEHWIPDDVLESEAERCLAFYEKETGLSAFKENGLGVRIEEVCEFLIHAAGFDLIHTKEIIVPDSERYAEYRDTAQTLWGCTKYTSKEVHILVPPKENIAHTLTQNFGFIHETGHVLIGSDETTANTFARYFSLPGTILKKRFIELANLHYDSSKHKGSLKYIFCELVGDFQVSGRTCLLRALDLGLIPESTRKLLWYEIILPPRC